MKRTAMIAIVIAALTFGVVGFAIAADESVVVNATVGNAFEMTLTGASTLTLATAPGEASVTETSSIRVKSNRLWEFSKGAVYTGPDFALFESFMSDTTSVATGTSRARGVHNIGTTYTLDLSNEVAALELQPGAYTASYTYTALQE